MKPSTIVMIHKTSCPYCEKAFPWMQAHAKEHKGCFIGEANKDDIAEFLELFQVKMYPTFVAFSKGKVVDVFYGDTKIEKVEAFVQKHLAQS